MVSLAWPWVLLALPLPFILRRLMSEANDLQEAGLRVPSFTGFTMLRDRSQAELLLNW
ncbi:MAG: BatB protein, partial [Proteobacteria bacterium]|nr:BatB protein [Pseudomonadota bacterium]